MLGRQGLASGHGRREMTRKLRRALALCSLLLLAVPVGAHHAVQAQFDFGNELVLAGVLRRVEFINPHVYLHLDVTDEATGEVTRWGFETIGPHAFRRAGFTREFKVGETYTFVGHRARDGHNLGFIVAVLLPDGRKITIYSGDPVASCKGHHDPECYAR